MELTSVLTDAPTRRTQIRAKALEGLVKAFPLTLRDKTIELHDPHVVERTFGPNDQKQALLEGGSLHEPVRATLVMKDSTGKEIERVKNFTLLNLPYFTERHTFVVDGNEYQVSNQIRMKPGVYTRKRANGELETSFNMSKGSNFELSLDAKKGHPYMAYGTTTIPLYPVLRRLGVSHEAIAKAWGRGTAEENQRSFIGKEDQALAKLYGKVIHPAQQVAGTADEHVAAIHAKFALTAMDPEVNKVTLGHAHDKVTPQAILDASHKLLSVYKSGDEVDDRDSLAFKTFHSVDDFIKERINLHARVIAMKTKGRAINKVSIREIMPSSPFSADIRTFLTGSRLSSIPTQINPMEMIDQAVKVTSLGEGGIASERAIPMEARQLHSTHLGILDPVRTPESFQAGVDIRAAMLTHRDNAGNLYTPVKNIRTDKFEYLSAKQMQHTVVAFPGQKMTGFVDAMKDGHVQHVPAAQVQYELYHTAQLYSPTSNLIPMMESIQGNRATMGSKMQTQALPLVDRQVPWVQVGARKLFGGGKDELSSFEHELGKLVVPCAPQAGRVVKIDSQYIYIDPTGKKKHAEEPGAIVRVHVVDPHGQHLEHHYLNANEWGAPAGRMDSGDTHQTAAARELEWRTGFRGAPEHFTHTHTETRPDGWLEHHVSVPHDRVVAVGKPQTEIRWAKHAHYTIPEPELLKYAGEPKRQVTIKGIKMKVELEKGDMRRGVNKETGEKWEKEMHAAYGKDELSSFERELGKLVVPCAPQAGRVVKIDSQYIYIDPTGKKKVAEETKLRYKTPDDDVYYHGSSHKIDTLRSGAWVTPHKEDAHSFGVPWDSNDLADKGDDADGRPPLSLKFKPGRAPNDLPLYVYEVSGPTKPADTNTGKRYSWNRQTTKDLPVKLVASFPSWRDWQGHLTKTAGEPKRQVTIKGIKMKVELEKGDMRRGVNKETGEKWEKEMHAAYGHIPKTRGHDNETVDIYLKEPGFFGEVYCVKQVKKDGTHDEDKLMVGFSSCEEAIECYKKHVPKWCFGSCQTLTWSEFEDYVDDFWHEKNAAEKNEDDGLIKVPYDTNFPFASKTYLHHNVVVNVGDHVKEDQHLADSNFTRNGELALGRNMKVGYMAYYGLNSNDAVVISEGAATKLTSEHMYKEVLDVDQDMTLRRELHRLYYGAKYTSEMYRHLDAEGVIKKGEKVMPHDIIIAAVRKTKLSATDALLGNLKKSLANPYREEVRTWDHDFEGEVIDVFKADKRVVVTIKTKEPMRIGDKLAGRHGNKGVISHIVPDAKMVQDAHGKPIDILYTSAGVISRINPAQIIETAVAKVAEKMGKPIIMENFTGRDNVQWAKDLLKKHGVQDKETVFDPVSGKHIKGVLVGPQYTLRLFKTTDSNFSARGTGAYDINQQPTKGGDEGAKGIGGMEFNGLVAHNARNVLRETSVLKSQKNDAFWRAAQLGLPLPPLKTSFAYDKFEHMIQAAGIRLEKKGSTATLRPLTDNDIMKMSAGEVQNEKLVKAKNLEPERGGLFDPAVTGGPTGTKWSHIELAEPLLNPVFHEPARRLLGLTNNALDELHAKEGGAALKKKLNQIDVDARLAQLRVSVKTVTPSKLDDVVKQIKALEALKAARLTPGDAYVLSKLPILPPVMRPILPGQTGGELVVGDSNYLYQNAILHNHALKAQVTGRLLPPDEHAVLRQNLFNAVGAVIGTQDSDNPKLQKRNVKGFIEHLTGKTTPKSSFFQKKLYKRQQDFSGRGTIAPDGSLGMDEVGIPEEMLWGMFSKFIIARLVRRGFPAVQANEMVEKRHPAARDALMAEIAERPVMVNRAPSLHRYNIIGAYAVPTPGKTIRVNAFMEPHMNADYDGDEQIGAVLLQVNTPIIDSWPAVWQDPQWRAMRRLGGSMTARMEEIVGYALSGDVYWCDLSEFPHLPEGRVQGHVTAYAIPDGVKIVAFHEATSTMSFQTPTQWSVHRDRAVEVVTLASGRQIITDDDPRAVFGVHAASGEYRRVRPKQADGMFVPVLHDLGSLTGGTGDTTTWPIPATGRDGRTRTHAALDASFGRLCGTLVGDGWASDNRNVCLAAADDSIVDGYRQDLRSVFLDAPNLGKTERIGGDFGSQVESRRWTVSSQAFAELMLPLMGSGAQNKHLPPFFLTAPRTFRTGLLAGLIDTDGSIALVKAKAKPKPQWLINYATTSLRLAREVVLLGKTLAVRASITSTRTPKGDSNWIVSFSTPDLHKLQSLPCACADKQERFRQFFAAPAPTAGSTASKDVIPTSVAVATRLATLYKQTTEYVMLIRARKTGYITRDLAKRVLADHPEVHNEPLLRDWLFHTTNNKVRWDRVVSYEVTGITETGYDLSVPGSETFMTVDGTVLSNTFQVHSPVMAPAVHEVKQMTLSNLIFGDRSKDDLLVKPAMEAVLGLNLATLASKPGGKVYHYKTKADAMAAYHRGEITLQDHVEIK